MINASPFPLFRLPVLNYEEVLKNLIVIDQFNLSKTSKKTERIVRKVLARSATFQSNTKKTDDVPFKFLRLPSAAQHEVLKSMKLFELFKLSTISTKAKNAVKSFTGYYSYQLRIRYHLLTLTNKSSKNDNLKLECKWIFNSNEKQNLTSCEWWKIYKTSWLPVEVIQSTAKIFTRNTKQAMYYLIEHIADVFHKPIIREIHFKGPYGCSIQNIMRKIKPLNLEFHRVNVSKNSPPARFDEIALDEFRDAKVLNITGPGVANDCFKHVPRLPFQFDSLTISYARWFNLDHLIKLFMNCKRIEIGGCFLWYSELKLFFNKWIQGSRLEYVKLPYKGAVRFPCIFVDVETTLISRAVVDGIKQRFRNQECYLIQQTNGIKAIVYKADGESFILTTDFKNEVEEEDEENEEEEEEIVEVEDEDDENVEEDVEVEDEKDVEEEKEEEEEDEEEEEEDVEVEEEEEDDENEVEEEEYEEDEESIDEDSNNDDDD